MPWTGRYRDVKGVGLRVLWYGGIGKKPTGQLLNGNGHVKFREAFNHGETTLRRDRGANSPARGLGGFPSASQRLP